MGHLIDSILHLDPTLVLVLVALVVFAEDAIFVGFVIPGESAAIVAGVSAGLGRVPLWLAILVVVLAAILGDTVGFEVGRLLFGPKLLESRWLVKHRARIELARALLRRRGALAVFVGRFTAFFRAMMPALAGSAGMRYRTFLIWNAIGGLIWGAGSVLLGYAAGTSYHVLEQRIGTYSTIAFAALIALALAVWLFHRHHHRAGV